MVAAELISRLLAAKLAALRKAAESWDSNPWMDNKRAPMPLNARKENYGN